MITIIIPITFDVKISNVQLTINSIVNQTYKNIKIFVGLNSCISITPESIKKICINSDIYVFDNVKTKYDILNNIISHVTDEWVGFAEPGDEWYDNKIEKQLQYIKSYSIIGCSCRFSGKKSGMPCLLYGKVNDSDFINGRAIIDNTVIMKKELCKWDTKYGIHADYKMFYKLHKKKYLCFNISELLLSCKVFEENNNDKIDVDILQKIIKKIKKELKTSEKYNYII